MFLIKKHIVIFLFYYNMLKLSNQKNKILKVFIIMSKITLKKLFDHSNSNKIVVIKDVLHLTIKPWNAVQMEHLQDTISIITEEVKKVRNSIKQGSTVLDLESDNTERLLEIIISLLRNKQIFSHIVDLVFVTIERGNSPMKVTVDGNEQLVDLFTKDEMKQEFDFNDYKKLVSAIIEINFGSNPFKSTETTEEEKENKKKDQ